MPNVPNDIPACAAGVPFLRVLPKEALGLLAGAMRHRHFGRGEVVALAGEPIEEMVVVANGRLDAVQGTTGGREQVVRTLGAGEFYGELALFAPTRHEADLVAAEPTDACLLARSAVQEVVRSHPEAAIRLVEALARRLARAERQIGDLGTRDVGQRLAAELARAAESGTPIAEGIRIQLGAPWVELARQLGTTPESLSRRLRSLADEGVIRQERPRTLIVLDLDRLRALAGL